MVEVMNVVAMEDEVNRDEVHIQGAGCSAAPVGSGFWCGGANVRLWP